MLNTDDENRIRGSHGDAVVVDPTELIDLAEYLESITSVVYWEGKSICGTGNDVRMIMNCGECDMHMIGPDGIADSIDDAEDTARILLIRKWNARWTLSDRGADELV